jgi:zinc transport system permease protein
VFAPVLFAQEEVHWLNELIGRLADLAPAGSFFHYGWNIRALLALILVSLSCGAVGSLVVAGRMAFFSDALAHCAFAGVSVGFLLFQLLLAGVAPASSFWQYVTPVMIVFGILVGLGIASVRQQTGLASDTVIGVFFAGAIGLAAVLRKLIQNRNLFSLEDFLFGDPILIGPDLLIALFFLAILTLAILAGIYNNLLLAGFNSSLALSRRVPIRTANYLFVILLAVIVNLCLRCVGVMLINALLIVPAATAVNLSRNMRQLFWLTIAICLAVSVSGQVISWETEVRTGVKLGTPGAIVLLSVALFFGSMILGPWLRQRRIA